MFANFFFAYGYKFTGSAVTRAYIDLTFAGQVVLQKELIFDVDSDTWFLEITEAESAANDGRTLVGHLVTVVGGVHAPCAVVTVNVQHPLTARRV